MVNQSLLTYLSIFKYKEIERLFGICLNVAEFPKILGSVTDMFIPLAEYKLCKRQLSIIKTQCGNEKVYRDFSGHF